jgi:3-methyladenine DNA glycosylase/8-oxoguanine DNA glycosylase
VGEVRIKIDRPLALRATLDPLGGVFRPDGWWAPMRTPEGPATLHLRRDGDEVLAIAYGTGADWALASVEGLIGWLDRPEDFRPDHGPVQELARRQPGLRIGRTGRVFEALLTAIVSQKVTGREAGRSLAALRRQFSDPAPGPLELRLPPDPQRLATTTYFELHPLGIEKRRADIIRKAATAAPRNELLASLKPEDARAELERIPGVGVWTSAQTVAVSHGDPDAVPVGDYHLKNVIAWHLAGRPRGTDDEMLELLEPFRPQRGRAIRLLATLGQAPKFGPRQPLRDIAGI